jgi:membrane-associated protease RseP (regulator of RpoE activity)
VAVPPAPPRASAWQSWGRHVVLFVLTTITVFLFGGPELVVGLMSIMLAHEFGHYFACRYYRIDATLPFFIPLPPPLGLVGTLGAVIRIRDRFPHRKALFDVGIAGPLAGFVVTLPVLLFGLLEARVVPDVQTGSGMHLGEPLLFQWLSTFFLGPTPEGMTVLLGPLGLAAWFGLFLTGLNLIPLGQLDGGHVVYALLRDKAALVFRVGFWACVALIYIGPSWILWSILMFFLGRRHPSTVDDFQPVGDGRVVVAVLGLVVFVLCFSPNPFPDSWPIFAEAWRQFRAPPLK